MAKEEIDSGTATGGGYHVFLSFRGPDTRNGFADCLYEFMKDRGIHIFRDEEELRPGKNISEILHAVQSSKIYIPIFSKDYASSKWCLQELTRMAQCTRQFPEKEIMPIFYDVDPLDVKLQTEVYKNALMKHEEELGCPEVKPWKEALTMVARIKGWHLKDQGEGKVIKDIVQRVLQKIPIRNRYLPPYLVGIDHRVSRLNKISDVGIRHQQVIVIWGKRGIGKTTLAKAIFNILSPKFESQCFLENIQESSSCGGIEKMQRKMVADLFSFSLSETCDFEEGNNVIKSGLPHKRVLVVFDDISYDDQFIQLMENFRQCGPGSRIIVTSRENIYRLYSWGKLVESFYFDYMYEMWEMDSECAHQLFTKLAFTTDSASPDLCDLSREIVKFLGGNPLALKVFGSHLRGQSRENWLSTVNKLKEVPCYNLPQQLQIIYDASFFVNEKRSNAMFMREALCHLSRDLGRQIICQGNDRQLGDRSRLWFSEMALDIVRAKQVDNRGSSEWIDLKPSLHDREVICGLINEKKALVNNIEGIDSQLKVFEEKVQSLQMQLERSKRKKNKIQVEVSQLEAKEKIYLRGIVALIGLMCAMLLLMLDKKTQFSLP
ncbi:TMV resistance protein N-like [Eucalyptus grandis]|uniref:TMV resistance protein N-like n=1 Tax=Eucalyptus grandis TaxID=71139 RepID=UPI00192EB7AB|nr:TMV resistance protein N-like [Eucalyptus grandis]